MIEKYIVDKENGIVECTLTDQFYAGNNQWTGKAKCSNEDIFDEEKGKEIAYLRAFVKWRRENLKYIKEVVDVRAEFCRYWQNVYQEGMKKLDNQKILLAKTLERLDKLVK